MSRTITLLLVWFSACTPSEKPHLSKEAGKTVATPDTKVSSAVIYRSTDLGKTWMPYALGIPADATVSSFLTGNGTTYATTDRDGIYRIKTGETKWLRIDADLPQQVDISAMASINQVLIIGTFRHGIFISHNEGRYWEQSTTLLNHTPVRSLLAHQNIVFAGTDDGIYKSVDQGNSWQQVFRGVQTNGFTVLHNKIYAALSNGAVMTTDEGANWKYIYKPLALHDISNDGESIYAMTLGDGLLKSKNDGLTWENVNQGMGETRWYTFEVKPIDRQLFAAQWNGIYSKDQRDGKWTIIKNGLPDSTAFSTLEVTERGLMAGIGLRKK